MKINVVREEIESFRRFTKKAEVALGSRPPGLHFVRGENRTNPRLGSNGASKSTLFDALCWCLTGKTVKGRPTTSVRPWGTSKKPRVAVEVTRDGARHLITRSPGGQGLAIDGKVAGQEDLEALTGLDHALLTQAVVMGQGRPLFLDLAPRDKMQLLSDVLGLERWERRADAAAERARRLGGRHQEVLGRLAALADAESGARGSLESAKNAQERWAGEHAERLEGKRRAAAAARQRAESLENKRGEVSVEVDRAGTAAKLLRPEVASAREKVRALGEEARALNKGAEDCGEDIRETSDLIKSFTDAKTCPMCGQSVKSGRAAEHAAELRAKAAGLMKKQKECEAGARRAATAARKLVEKLKTQEQELAGLEEGERRADGALRLLDRELAGAQAEKHAAERTLRDAEEEVNPHRETAARARKQLAQAKRGVAEAERRSSKLAAATERAQFWSRGFRDIRLMVIEDLLTDLTETTAEMLEALGIGDWRVVYKTERETRAGTTQRALHVEIESPASEAVPDWEDCSGGEAQRLRLAASLALSEVLLAHAGAQVGIRVLDEPTRSLSPEGIEDLCACLADYARTSNLRIFYVDHNTRDGAQFESVIKVVRDKSGARVEEG